MMTTDRPTRTLTLVAPAPVATVYPFPVLNPRQVLETVGVVAVSTLSGSWQELNQDSYFGQAAAAVRFKDMLLPFIWVARQYLIERAGAAYQAIPMAARANLESELLATLDALCQQGLRASQQTALASTLEEVVTFYNHRGLRLFCWAHPDLAEELADTLVTWVNSVLRMLQGGSRF